MRVRKAAAVEENTAKIYIMCFDIGQKCTKYKY